MNVKVAYVTMTYYYTDFLFSALVVEEPIEVLSSIDERHQKWYRPEERYKKIGMILQYNRSSVDWTLSDTKNLLSEVEGKLAKKSDAEYFIINVPPGFSDEIPVQNFQKNFRMPAPRVVSR